LRFIAIFILVYEILWIAVVDSRFNLKPFCTLDLVGKTSLCDGLNAFSMAWQKLASKGERVADLKGIQKALKEAASLLKKRSGSKSAELASPRDPKDASQLLFHQTECDIHAYGRSAQNNDLHLQMVNLDFRGAFLGF
jgi:hypothetical protein